MAVTAPSISQNGRFEPFFLQVARNQISWHKSVIVFGINDDIGTAAETIWPFGGVISYPAAAIAMKVSSSSLDDADLGTGARTVVINGLDSNYNEISETVTLNGQTAVNTTASFLRIQSAYVATAGSGLAAAGTIYIGTGTVTSGVPATIYGGIALGANISQTASWTVPAGYTGYVLSGGVSTAGQAGGQHLVGNLVTRGTNGIPLASGVVTLENGSSNFEFIVPIAVPEKTAIEAQAIGSAASNDASAYFEVLYIKNDASV